MAEINSNRRNKKAFEYIKEYWDKVYKDLEKEEATHGLEVNMNEIKEFRFMQNELGAVKIEGRRNHQKNWKNILPDDAIFGSLSAAKDYLLKWQAYQNWKEVE